MRTDGAREVVATEVTFSYSFFYPISRKKQRFFSEVDFFNFSTKISFPRNFETLVKTLSKIFFLIRA